MTELGTSFVSHLAGSSGGGLGSMADTCLVVNITIGKNASSADGGGVDASALVSNHFLSNCILAENTADADNRGVGHGPHFDGGDFSLCFGQGPLHTGVEFASHRREFMIHRPRRNRVSPAMRGLVRETSLAAEHFVQPLFLTEGKADEPIASMPGLQRWSREGMLREIERSMGLGVRAFVLFPRIADALKTSDAEEAWNDAGMLPLSVSAIKKRFPEACVITDVALDPYSSDGHDGLVAEDGRILNDETVETLCRQALCQAEAGADIVSPSDMMDGRVGAIREALDDEGFTEVAILSYTAKYASALYGPFRGALDSAPRAGDKMTYQMDPANAREALREAALDEAEGADILMVKPAGAYLDIIALLRGATALPVAAYQVSGEYLMIKAAGASGWLDERKLVMESLLGIRRAGADVILTYFAPQAAQWLKEDA